MLYRLYWQKFIAIKWQYLGKQNRLSRCLKFWIIMKLDRSQRPHKFDRPNMALWAFHAVCSAECWVILLRSMPSHTTPVQQIDSSSILCILYNMCATRLKHYEYCPIDLADVRTDASALNTFPTRVSFFGRAIDFHSLGLSFPIYKNLWWVASQ